MYFPALNGADRKVENDDSSCSVACTTRCCRSARVTSLSDGLRRFSRIRE